MYSFLFSLFIHFSFSQREHSVIDFSAYILARLFKFCIHLESGQVYCLKDNQEAYFNFCLLVSFSFVMHMAISINDISGIASPIVLKFCVNVYHD